MMAKEEKRNIFSRVFTHKVFVITTLVIYALPLLGIWSGLISVSSGTSNAANVDQWPLVRIRSASRSHTQWVAIAAKSVALQYMNALLGQNYPQMWSLLHPQIQAKWSNE